MTVGSGPGLEVVVERQHLGWQFNFFPQGLPMSKFQVWLVPVDGGPVGVLYADPEPDAAGFGFMHPNPPYGRYIFAVASTDTIVTAEYTIQEADDFLVPDWIPARTLQYGISITSGHIKADSEVVVTLQNDQGGEPLRLPVESQRDGYVFVQTPPLARGEYTLVATIDGKKFTAPLSVLEVPMLNGMESHQPASYEAHTVTLHGGDLWTFAEDRLPQIQILDANRDYAVIRPVEPEFVSDKEVQFMFPAGLPSGIWQMAAQMDGSYVARYSIFVGFDLDPGLQLGVPEQTITATAAGVTFEEGAEISIHHEGVTASDVRVLEDPHQIQFTLRGELPEGFFSFWVTRPDGYMIGHTTILWANQPGTTPPTESTPSEGATPEATPPVFPDVPADHWARPDLEAMAARNIVRGDQEGRFNPDANVTRAEVAALLVCTLGLEHVTPSEPSFGDVATADWFFADVETAAAAGLIQGHAGQFRPRDQISRQEVAVILARALRERDAASSVRAETAEALRTALAPETAEAVLCGLSDRASIAAWAEADVVLVYHLGLMDGRSETSFEPTAPATRLEVVVGLKRLLERLGEL